MSREIESIHIPQPIPYLEMLEQQRVRRLAVEEHRATNALFLLEHTPVITLGRNTHPEHLLLTKERYAQEGIEVVEVDRGGDVTYHGPGQLVAYPILDLNQWRCSVGWYLRTLEEVIIRVLREYGLQGERMEGFTGVWVNGAKVAAIGIGVHKWVTFHGLSLNVAPDMRHFGFIIPCGIADKPVTSLSQLLGRNIDLQKVKQHLETHFLDTFEVTPLPS
ncbi:MAG TPA: lipoyl(octanoyl) transferase LipB [Candidatus Hydrogenedentes bacterium]|nr:lipoyl(octanoyl) transferase LipB [Candidatus Hydrogenedentota bacterium]